MNRSESKKRRTTHPRSESTAADSRARLLQSAELLFSSKGFREVSVRDIAAHAGVNSAMIRYHFGSKQALYDEIVRIHAVPLSKERLRQLKAITQNGRQPSVEEILKAWLLPWLQLGRIAQGKAVHLRITANAFHGKLEQAKEFSRHTQRAFNVFVKILHGCLPHLAKNTLEWRLHFVTGALAFGIRHPYPLIALSGGLCDPNKLEAVFNQILPYAVSGFCAEKESACLDKA